MASASSKAPSPSRAASMALFVRDPEGLFPPPTPSPSPEDWPTYQICQSPTCFLPCIAPRKHCCRPCRLGMQKHSPRCQVGRRNPTMTPTFRPFQNYDANNSCVRWTTLPHRHCCSRCKETKGQVHKASCSYRQPHQIQYVSKKETINLDAMD